MASGAQPDPWYLSLLGIAESFRTSNPPNIRLCLHCLQTILNLKPPPRIEARTRLQIGSILFSHTKNIDLARSNLESSWSLSSTIPSFDDVKFEAASLLGQIYEKQKQVNMAKPILRKAVEMSNQAPYWRCRLLFQLASIHVQERDFVSAVGLLGVGSEYSDRMGAGYTKILFMLSRGMLLLVSKNLQEVHQVLSRSGELIESWPGHQSRKESLKVFFLILQVCHFLMAGQVKSVKPALKQLQQSIQSITALPTDDVEMGALPSNLEDFQWLPKEHMCVLVYLVTVMHSMQAGYLDKAQKYTDKALMQIEKLKMLDSNPLLSAFQLMLLEHIIMCRLITGNKTIAIQEICQACQLCQQTPRLLQTHGAQLHTLLGLYAMSMNCMDAAEAQFKAAIRVSNDPHLWSFNNLNLAIVFARSNRHGDFMEMLERIDPERIPVGSHSLKASAYYVRGLQTFFHNKYNESKRYLRETLKMANAEDLNRLTSCSLVLLGNIFLVQGNCEEAMNMVTPAMQLATKIPDVNVQIWASALLRDLYRAVGDPAREAEENRVHQSFSQSLIQDHLQSTQQSEHKLIHWTEGPCTAHLMGLQNESGHVL